MRQLGAIGYLQESAVTKASEQIPIHDPARAWEGYNLYVSGHESTAFLVDMEGNLLHTWSKSFSEIWPGKESHHFGFPNMKSFFRQCYLAPKGDLLCIFELFGIVKLDQNSNILWKFENVAHHDMDVTEDGHTYVLGKRVELEDGGPIQKFRLYPTINVLDRDGTLLREIDVYKCFEKSQYRALLFDVEEYGDLFHNNTLRVLDGSQVQRSAHFKKGNILISTPLLDAVYILDPVAESIVWLVRSLSRSQHDPSLLDNGNILLFNNQWDGERSQLIELNPFTQEVEWEYSSEDRAPFFSECCGTVQRLPNGNTLAAVTDQAFAFEVTPDGERVWEFHNLATVAVGDAGSWAGDDRAASLFKLRRYPIEFFEEWLPGIDN